MKKSLGSCLVVIITFITVLAMASFKPSFNDELLNETYVSDDKEDEEVLRPEGTGYIFEDFEKGINIPLDKTKEEKKSPDEVEDKTSINYQYDRLRRALKEQLEALEYQRVVESDMDIQRMIREYRILASKKPSERLEENITLGDKVSLLKIARYLSLKDMNRIREAIDKGASEEELQSIWDTLKDKVPEKDYDKLVQIVSKYEE